MSNLWVESSEINPPPAALTKINRRHEILDSRNKIMSYFLLVDRYALCSARVTGFTGDPTSLACDNMYVGHGFVISGCTQSHPRLCEFSV